MKDLNTFDKINEQQKEERKSMNTLQKYEKDELQLKKVFVLNGFFNCL